MRPDDVQARIETDGVSITLPRLRVVVSDQQAEQLRNVLNTVLPVNEQAPPTGEPCQYCEGTGYGPGGQPQGVEPSRYMLCMWDHVDPELCGPYKDEQDRIEASQDFQRAHGDGNSAFRVDAGGYLKIEPFADTEPGTPCPACEAWADGGRLLSADEWHAAGNAICSQCRFSGRTGGMTKPRRIEWISTAWIEGRNATVHENSDAQFELHTYETQHGHQRLAGKAKFAHRARAERAGEAWRLRGEWDMSEAIRGCCLCQCTATGEVYGLPVCDYHKDHSEDEPRCPDCVPVHTGDRVLDPADNTWRTVTRLDLAENTAHMADGGCMSIDAAGECEKRLPSEVLPS